MKDPRKLPESLGQIWPAAWASPGQSRATAGPGHFSASQVVEKQKKQVADSDYDAQQWKNEQNQRLALICSLLRYVWTFHEAQRAELGAAGLILRGRLSHKPACGAARSASI
ncbi:hypothetical protein ACUXV3_20195 (plasmid) [Roseobacteraceae bacterium NS-SX3]